MGRVMISSEEEAYEVFSEINLSFSQTRTLFILGIQSESIPISDIADRVRLSVAAAGRNVDQLVQAGLVSRTEDLSDRRVKLVALTDRGRQIVWAHQEAKRGAVRSLLASLTSDQCEAIAAALEPLATCRLPDHQKDSSHVS